MYVCHMGDLLGEAKHFGSKGLLACVCGTCVCVHVCVHVCVWCVCVCVCMCVCACVCVYGVGVIVGEGVGLWVSGCDCWFGCVTVYNLC